MTAQTFRNEAAEAAVGNGRREANEFAIRPIEEKDLPGLEWDGVYLHFRRLFRQAYEDMRIGTRHLLMVEHTPTGGMVGQIFIQWSSSDPRFADGTRRGYLYALRIKPAFRCRGLGTRILAAAENELHRRGMDTASIGVEKDNPRARALYERLGYRVIAEDPGRWSYVDHEGNIREVLEPAWLMEKRIRGGHEED
ncbi:MAG: GNAT family N-acetyltransferase [Anaerolineales bacterium]|nr:GNAT family N-acetyltransferase [Anaerolineales bacterium]